MQVNTQCMSRISSRNIERNVKRTANRAVLKIAGKGVRFYSILKHVGRRSGQEYATPVTAFPLGDGFVIALLDGTATEVDWCRNIIAAGGCALKTLGREYVLEKPEIIPASQALAAYPLLPWRLMLQARDIQQFLWVHKQHESPTAEQGGQS